MSKKRYAIVRVDNNCPLYLREFTDQEAQAMFCCSGKYMCKNCRYGDTKEDFERKIETAITRMIQRKNIVIKYRNFDISMTIKNLSKTISEYLGIEK